MYTVTDITLLEANKIIIAMKDSHALGYARIATTRLRMSLGLDIVCLQHKDYYLYLGNTSYAADAETLASIYDVRATTWYHYYG